METRLETVSAMSASFLLLCAHLVQARDQPREISDCHRVDNRRRAVTHRSEVKQVESPQCPQVTVKDPAQPGRDPGTGRDRDSAAFPPAGLVGSASAATAFPSAAAPAASPNALNSFIVAKSSDKLAAVSPFCSRITQYRHCIDFSHATLSVSPSDLYQGRGARPVYW